MILEMQVRDAGQILQVPTGFQFCKLQVMPIKSELHVRFSSIKSEHHNFVKS